MEILVTGDQSRIDKSWSPINRSAAGRRRCRDGYSPAAGIGTLDVANFAEALMKSY
jgi:hypothetical protein